MSDLGQKRLELRQRMTEIQAELESTGKAFFKEASAEFFDDFPEVESFSWTQYAPYFNDGDECVFHVHAYGNATLVDGETTEIGDWYSRRTPETHEDKRDAAYTELIEGMEESVMLTLFGNHVEVVVHRNGTIDVEGYDHD